MQFRRKSNWKWLKRVNLSSSKTLSDYKDFLDNSRQKVLEDLKNLISYIMIPRSSSDSERGFNCMNLMKTDKRFNNWVRFKFNVYEVVPIL